MFFLQYIARLTIESFKLCGVMSCSCPELAVVKSPARGVAARARDGKKSHSIFDWIDKSCMMMRRFKTMSKRTITTAKGKSSEWA